MKVKVIEEQRKHYGDLSTVDLLKDKVYDATIEYWGKNANIEMYRIIDESGEDYAYFPCLFEIVEE